MADIKLKYSAEQSITITLNSLADGSDVYSSVIDNSSNLFINALLHGIVVGSAAGNTDVIEIYLCGSPDNSDFDTDEGTQLLGVVKLNGTTTVKFTINLERAGVLHLPKYWKIRVVNNSGAALGSNGNSMSFVGLQYQTV